MPIDTTKGDLELSKLLLESIPPMMRSVRKVLRETKGATMTVPQFRVLAYVSLQPCTSKQLADWHGVSLPAISRMVNCLVRRQLLMRTPDALDRRQVQLHVSKKGRKAFTCVHRAVQKKLAEHIAALREADKKALMGGLLVLKELFSEI